MEGVFFLPSPNESETRMRHVWCPAAQLVVQVKGVIENRCGHDVLMVDACVMQVLGCSCLRVPEKRVLCVVDREVAAGKW